MNTGGLRHQRQAQQSRVATAPLILEQWPADMGHDIALTGLPDLGPTAALARQVSPGRHAAPAYVHRQCCPSKARS
jgi:hypothetical protein